MRPLPFSVPGFDNDLNEKIDRVMQRAVADENALVYAFGERWGPEPGTKDKYFGFLPGNGIHDIHMNQGNCGRFVGRQRRVSGRRMLVHFPGPAGMDRGLPEVPVATWHTDDRTGHTIAAPAPGSPTAPGHRQPPEPPTTDDPEGLVRIVAALVNRDAVARGRGGDAAQHGAHTTSTSTAGRCSTPRRSGCRSRSALTRGRDTRRPVSQPLALSNKGGVITLVDDKGLKVHGVSYTKEQARNPGWTIVF